MAQASSNLVISAFEATPLHEIPVKVQHLRATFRSGRTKNIQFRIAQLRKLYWSIVDNTPLIEESLKRDLRKCQFESIISEIDWVKRECLDQINNIEKWAKDENVVNVPFEFKPMGYRIRNEPLGVILAIGSYNYPFQLNLTPVIGAIAAGNCVILKASESSPNSAMVLAKIFDDALDPDCYTYVNGALPESQAILDQKFDKIVFTGGKGVGKIIAQKAAETLTPVLLELGGQNPAFVTKNANLKLAARRLLFQKALNAGQVCLSHNYILVERSVLSPLIGELNSQLRAFMPKGAKRSPDYSRVVNIHHFNRLKKMLDSTQGKIVLGGSMDESDLFIEPTAVLVDSIEDSMMVQESFGPIFSIMAYDTLDQAIDIANEVDPTPLALFCFGTDAEANKVLDNVTSGGATINDSFLHCQIPQSPIGGVGQSGMGSYHGYYSFKAFSHQRPIAKTPSWAEAVLRVRYMPYSWPHLKRLYRLNGMKPNFDRQGNPTRGITYLIGLVLSLGGKTAKAALLRWAILIMAAAIGMKNDSLNQWLLK
ncbi:Aldehyde/histidinol dehydrogenase [Mariannaea sp. PMI_226]|nr:Aldehyde/histidinol dehydrogenase [Mariannaea sp. PMI_226]